MELLRVDESKCKKHGICAAGACPQDLIKIQEDTGYPGLIPGGDKACIRCGSCLAVCPNNALIHSDIPPEECVRIRPELILNEEQADQFLRSRRAIRAFKDKPVEKEKIKRLIERARYAPTGGNRQQLEWQVLTDKRKIHEIAGMVVECFRRIIKEKSHLPETQLWYGPLMPLFKLWDAGHDTILRNAPVLVTVSASNQASTGMADVVTALTYLSLLAPTMELGTCFCGLLQKAITLSPAIKDSLGIPADHPDYFPMILGYPKDKYYQMPPRKPPKITFG